MLSEKNIYLDYQSTTPIDPIVLEDMLPYFNIHFANPHSTEHEMGSFVSKKVEVYRNKVAKIINADSSEIIFTSGATESNNIAIKGVSRFYKSNLKDEIITFNTEHKCVLESFNDLKGEGFKVKILPVKSDGIIDFKDLEKAISDRTLLISVMALNNEIGVIQPLEEIGKICKKNNIFFHSDCAQALGKINLDVIKLNIDLLSLSSHKIYGPKGIGALYIRKKPRVRIKPLFSGGFQERGIRSGTLPSHLCIGFGKACELAENYLNDENKRIKLLSESFINNISINNLDFKINGSIKNRWPGNINLQINGVKAIDLINEARDICFSLGSACSDNSIEPSYVLKALSLNEKEAESSFRISLGRMTTQDEVIMASNRLCSVAKSLLI